MADMQTLGGPGSGNFGHEGRPGERGGSGGGGEGDVKGTTFNREGRQVKVTVPAAKGYDSKAHVENVRSRLRESMNAGVSQIRKDELISEIKMFDKGETKNITVKIPGHHEFSMSRDEAKAVLEELKRDELRHYEGGARSLHLLGATGLARSVIEAGKNWLVIPVVALMEGVIHAVNVATPEFVPLDTLKKAAASWNGKPITLGHPKRGGKQCSADAPDILEAHGIGLIKNSRIEGTKLLQDAWVDVERAKKLHPEMYARLAANKTEEVSVGAFVRTDSQPSSHNGKGFTASWIDATGDHLAFLPGGRGACSVEMGCGTHRAAMHFVAAESIELLPGEAVTVFSALEGVSLDKRLQAVNDAVYKKWSSQQNQVTPSTMAYPVEVFDGSVIVRNGTKLLAMTYDIDADGVVTLGEPTEVKQTYVAAAAKYAECETCHGMGQIKDGDTQKDCPSCDGEGKLRAAAGARHSASDTKMIQAVHDHAASLGASCDRKNLETAEAKPTRPIKHEGGKFVLYSQDGQRKLAEHSSQKEAEAHDVAIQRALGER